MTMRLLRNCVAVAVCASLFAACSASQKAVLPQAETDATPHTRVIYAHADEHPMHPAPYTGKAHDGYVPRHVHLQEVVASTVSLQDHLNSINAALRSDNHVSPMAIQTSNDAGGQGGYYIGNPYGTPDGALGNGAIWSAQDAVPPDGYYNIVLPQPPPCQPDHACGNYLYAPTTHGPNGNCFEIASDYQDTSAQQYVGYTYYYLLIWDFCATYPAQNAHLIAMDSNFFDQYVRKFTNGDHRPQYIQEVYPDASGVWHVLLYNVLTGQYDDIMDQAGTYTGNNYSGWSIFETHYLYYTADPSINSLECPNIPNIGMSGLRVYANGTWEYATMSGSIQIRNPSTGNAQCFDSSSLPYYTLTPYSADWAWTMIDPAMNVSPTYTTGGYLPGPGSGGGNWSGGGGGGGYHPPTK